MVLSFLHKSVALGALTVISVASLAACASGGSTDGDQAGTTTREASAYRASHLCVLNDTDKTIMSVGEYEMTRTGESHPDPTGPLKPGATWCTDGYESFVGEDGVVQDASVEVRFNATNGDFARFAVRNPGGTYPIMVVGQEDWETLFFQPGILGWVWETDITVPNPEEFNPKTGPSHDFHLRRLNDTPDFKEWLVTVRR
ncbi:MAG: hypothetical protein ACOYNK_06765 [Microbacteriaceae bacterium]